MAPRKRDTKAVARPRVAEPRRLGRAAASSADVAEQSGLVMSTPKYEASSRARTARRPAARGKWSEEHLLTSDKSLLIDLDLVKLLAHPEAWNCLEESEKREILDLLPPDVHPQAQDTLSDPDAKLPPIPDSFIRYSNNWRDGVRQFQLDLQNGRYDPEWLHQAQEARQQREKGDFDDFKEREYEQFWGQKQKAIWGHLPEKLGDIWKFYYVYGRGPGKIVIEKEVRVHGRDGAKLTFAIPPGERVFLRSNFNKAEACSTPEKGGKDVKVDLDTESHPVPSPWDTKQVQLEDPEFQVINATSNGEEMKLATDQAPQEISTSCNNEEIQLGNGQASRGLPAASTEEMNIDTDTPTQPVIALSNDEESQQETPFSVVIFSPGGTRSQKPKRTIPGPEPQPPVKRKRGRPPKNPPKQPEPEPPKEPEVSRETEVYHRDEHSPTAPLSFMSILNSKIEENDKAAAEPSQPSPSQLESTLSAFSSTYEPPESPAPKLSTPVEQSSVANTNGKNDKAELSTAQSDTPVDSAEALAEALDEAEKEEVNKSTTTISELDEIIVPNLPSPQALVSKILQIDGRMPNGRTANAWKEIRCYRNNQDMGSLFDVREAWFLQHGLLK
ncbi:hypothetical protein N7445_005932 [Penicillium cf. griseofulvum]|nr:hypothetical protein N7445_005932 [Penicillium cf. griseofulvum]